MKPRFAELHPKTEYHDALLETGLGRSLARAIVAFQLIEDALRSAAEFCSAPAVESEIDAKFLPTIDDTAFRRTEKLLEVIKQLRKRFLSLVPADKALRKRSFLLSERTHADTLAAVCSDLRDIEEVPDGDPETAEAAEHHDSRQLDYRRRQSSIRLFEEREARCRQVGFAMAYCTTSRVDY